ncbi:MAG: AAA family ATPase, partial [Pseudomonadota bacterium]
MYEETYGLREKPFSLVPDPDFLFLSRLHRGALNTLEYGLQEEASFTLISGEVGSGKTILVRRFLRMIGDRVAVGVVTSTPRNKSSVLDRILLAFGLDYRGKSHTEQHETFMRFLEAQEARKRRTILIIDEAQNLDAQALEELSMLSNINVDKNVLLQVVLVGQPEILEILNRKELRQFAQRITLNFKLLPLTFPETRNYIRHRIHVAGGNPETFNPEACAVIHLLSGGLPRLINSLCDSALVYGYGEGRVVLDGETVIEVAIDMARGGLANIPAVDANFNADKVLRRARELSEGIGPDDDQELPDETETRFDPYLPSPEPEGGIEPESAAKSEPSGKSALARIFSSKDKPASKSSQPIVLAIGSDRPDKSPREQLTIQSNGRLEDVNDYITPIVDEEHSVRIDENRYRKRKYIAVAAFALSALMTAGLIWKFKLDLLGPVEVDSSQSVNMDVKKATPPLSPGPATDRAADVAANQPETAAPVSPTPALLPMEEIEPAA